MAINPDLPIDKTHKSLSSWKRDSNEGNWPFCKETWAEPSEMQTAGVPQRRPPRAGAARAGGGRGGNRRGRFPEKLTYIIAISLFSLFERQTMGRGREREIGHPRVHSLNAYNTLGLVHAQARKQELILGLPRRRQTH